MQAQLIGVRRVDMTDQSGKAVKGYSCFITYPSEGVEGYEAEKRFVSDDLASLCAWSPAVGKLVDLDFNPKGRLTRIATVREK